VSALRSMLEDEFATVVAGGQGKLSGKIFRIGHLGLVEDQDIRDTLDHLAQTLDKLGYRAPVSG